MVSTVLKGHKAVLAKDFVEWAIMMEGKERHVADTAIQNVRVSTVFLGMDHSYGWAEDRTPVLFETMVFGGEHDEYQRRYSTWEEAEKGHHETCAMVCEVVG